MYVDPVQGDAPVRVLPCLCGTLHCVPDLCFSDTPGLRRPSTRILAHYLICRTVGCTRTGSPTLALGTYVMFFKTGLNSRFSFLLC